MSYGRAPDAWSTCSNEDFKAWYNRQGYYCARTSKFIFFLFLVRFSSL